MASRSRSAAIVLAVLVLALGSFSLHSLFQLRRQRTELDLLRAREQKARAAFAELERQRQGQPSAPPASGEPGALLRAAGPIAFPQDAAARLEELRLLSQTQERLSSTEASLREVEARTSDLETRLSALTQENQNLRQAAQDVSEKLDTSGRMVAALETEMKSRNERLQQLEAQNKEIRARNDQLARQQEQNRTLGFEMEELQRRREVYLTNILRRYREVTDFYRSLALRLENPREGSAPTNAELARIQNTITLADEDLRQLHALNQQMTGLQRKMGGR